MWRCHISIVAFFAGCGIWEEALGAGQACSKVSLQLRKCTRGMDFVRDHQLSLFTRGLLTLQPALSNNPTEPGNWELLKLEQTLLKLSADCSRGVLYWLAVPNLEGKWVLRWSSALIIWFIKYCTWKRNWKTIFVILQVHREWCVQRIHSNPCPARSCQGVGCVTRWHHSLASLHSCRYHSVEEAEEQRYPFSPGSPGSPFHSALLLLILRGTLLLAGSEKQYKRLCGSNQKSVKNLWTGLPEVVTKQLPCLVHTYKETPPPGVDPKTWLERYD